MRTTKLVMPIGQYKCYPIEDVVKEDPLYIYWLLDNCDNNTYYMLLSAIAEVHPDIKYDVYKGFKNKYREEKEHKDWLWDIQKEKWKRDREIERSHRSRSRGCNDDYWRDETWCIWANLPEGDYC